MKTSLKWLRDYADIPEKAKDLAAKLTAVGLEVEGIETSGAIPAGVVTAKILSRKKHENSDHLNICDVTTGTGDPLQIVCGAPNCDAGNIVPLAKIGTDFGDGFVIKESKLRGVESNGMMCSARELGIGADHSGLLILPENTPLGIPLTDLYASDTVIDWEVTPNRPDWLSHIGIAREAVGAANLHLPKENITIKPNSNVHQMAKVTVHAPDLCPRYIARVFENVKIGPSPTWMVQRLEAVGLRSINNVVDITNFIMLEFGQPLHAFDLRHLAGAEINVRRAKDGEELITLDDTKLKLTSDNLLIADQEKGVALAGIMGGQNSMITDDTTTVLLEAASFDRSNIRISSRNLNKKTDSSYCYERGVSPEMTGLASARAATLLCELAGAQQLDGVIDCYEKPWQPEEISCRVQRVNDLLGITLSEDEIVECFVHRGIDIVSKTADKIVVHTPYWRFDLHAEHDLIEEVAQMRGLDSIPEAPIMSKLGGPMREDTLYPIEQVRSELLGLGFDEMMNYSMWSQKACLQGTTLTKDQLVKVDNPISSDTACMRPTLLPGVLQVINYNVSRNQHDLAVFEIGKVFCKADEKFIESTQVALAMTGKRNPEMYGAEREAEVDFYSMKGCLESWIETRALKGCSIKALEHPAFKHGSAAAVVQKGKNIIVFGEAAPELVKGIRLRAPLFFAMADLKDILNAKSNAKKYDVLPQFPGTSCDITLVAPKKLCHQDVVNAVKSMNLPMFKNIELFDIYEDSKALGEGMRSMSYSVNFVNPERTMTDDEANELQAKIRKGLAKKLNVELR